MKARRNISQVISIIFLLGILSFVGSAGGGIYHTFSGPDYCEWGIDCSQNHVGNVAYVDILYSGTPEPGIISDVVLFPPFNYYETDGESYIRVFPNEPIDLTGPPRKIPMVTFSTTADLGVLGGPTPFSFVEYETTGAQHSGIIFNVEGDQVIPTLSRWPLIILVFLLLTIGAFALWRRERGPNSP